MQLHVLLISAINNKIRAREKIELTFRCPYEKTDVL